MTGLERSFFGVPLLLSRCPSRSASLGLEFLYFWGRLGSSQRIETEANIIQLKEENHGEAERTRWINNRH